MSNLTTLAGDPLITQQFGWNITTNTTGDVIAKFRSGVHLS